jgi:SpoVK/Ycf46/Vps4 family AAA+-type ATPase
MADTPQLKNLNILLEYRSWFERLLELRTRELRRRERGAMLDDEDELEEEGRMRASLDHDAAALEVRLSEAAGAADEPPIVRLARSYGLSGVEVRVLLLALMPAIDTGFRMRIARYKDNILFNYVDVDLVANLFWDDDRDKLEALSSFGPQERLARHRLLRLVHHGDLTNDDLINQELRLPERVVNFLLGHKVLATGLAAFATLSEARLTFDEVFVPAEDKARVRSLLASAERGVAQGAFLFIGGPGTGKTSFCEAMAHYSGKQLLVIDCARWLTGADIHSDPRRTVDDVFREAVFQNAVLALENVGVLLEPRSPLVGALVEALNEHHGVTVLSMTKRDGLDAMIERAILIELRFERPLIADRIHLWRHFVPTQARLDPDVDLELIAHQFDLPGGYIRNAMQVALNRAAAREPERPVITAEDLSDGAHAQLRGDMTDFTQRSQIGLSMDDLILPKLEMSQVQSLLGACRNQQRVMKEWGFGKKLVTGRGIVALFLGEPGTGKTLCAEIMANALGMQLYQVAIPKLVSKWIGETEKNIATVFSKARATRSMLLFDEADALFTSRVEVKSSTDRYSNLEVNALLQEIERFDGIVLLTTNRDKDFDKAFKRRIMFQIRFPFPKPEDRARIWSHLLPPEVPRDEELEFDALARNFELAGGNIKNILLRAAYKAMDVGTGLTMPILAASAEEESRSAGKLFRMPGDDDDY